MASSPLLVGIPDPTSARHLPDAPLTAFCRKAPKEEKLDKERPKQGKARTRGCRNRDRLAGAALVPFARRVQEAPPCSSRSLPSRAAPRSAAPAGATAAGRSVLGLLAALLRVLFVLSGTDRSWPYTVFYEGDSETFFRFARALLAGELYDGGIPFHPPGFAFFLAGLHLLVGAGAANAAVPHLAIKLILAVVVGGGSVALLYLAAAAALGRTVAIVTALLAAFHFGLYVLAVAPVGDGLFQLLLLAAIILVVRRPEGGARDRPPRSSSVSSGARWRSPARKGSSWADSSSDSVPSFPGRTLQPAKAPRDGEPSSRGPRSP